jgi:hypothetical protein
MEFFSNPTRIKALQEPSLQNVLDSCLFEPGAWERDGESHILPKVIPDPERSALSTPLGVLMNELQMSPELLLRCLGIMVDYAIEVDTGRYNPSSSLLALYILRLVVRVEEFALYLIWHDDWQRQLAAADAAGTTEAAAERLIGSGWATAVRGLDSHGAKSVARLRLWQQEIRGRIDDEIFPMIQRWTIDLTRTGDLETACIMRAHLAYCYKNVREADLDFRAVSTLLSSQIFITSRYSFQLDVGRNQVLKRDASLEKVVGKSLHIPQTELFQMLSQMELSQKLSQSELSLTLLCQKLFHASSRGSILMATPSQQHPLVLPECCHLCLDCTRSMSTTI